VWMDFATGGGGVAGVLAEALAVLSSAFRNVLMRRKRTTTDFFINPPFAWEVRRLADYSSQTHYERAPLWSKLTVNQTTTLYDKEHPHG
jgi:hypothetical protein